MQETSRFQWPIPEWTSDWLEWQQKFVDLMNGADSDVFGNLEASKVIFNEIPEASIIDDGGIKKLSMADDLTLISRTFNTRVVVDSSTDLELKPNYMIGLVMTPGAVGVQNLQWQLISSALIDPAVQIFGYVDENHKILWFNASTLAEADGSVAMFSFTGGGGGDTYWARNATGTPYLVPVTASDLVRVGDGTQAEPGLVGSGDPDTGIYWPGGNILGVSLGGREHVRFYNDGSGTVMSVDGGESGEFDQWDFKILHERTHSGPPAQIQIKTIAGTNGSQISIHSTFTDNLSTGTATFNAGAQGGHATSSFSTIAGGDDIGADRNATTYLNATAYHGIGALYVEMFGRDQSSIRINSRVLAANAYLDLCATGNTNTDYTGGYIRIGFNDDADYRPEHIQFFTKTLQASAWTNKYFEVDRGEVGDWTTFKANFGEVSMVEAFNALASAGLWSIEGSYIYPKAGASSLSVLANGYYIEDTGITDPTGMAWESSRLAFYYQGNPKVFVGDNKVGVGVADPQVGMHIGSWLGYHSLSSSSDLIVSNAAEIQGYLYLALRLSLGDNAHTYMRIGYYADDGAVIGLGNTDGGANRHLIITDSANMVRDHDHLALSADPTVYVHSGTDPDVDNTQYLYFYHDKARSRFGSGKGPIVLGDGTPTEAATTNDVYVSGNFETQGTTFFGGPARLKDGNALVFGDGSDAEMRWDISQTNHALLIDVSGSRNIIVCDASGVNFGHPVNTNPTLYIQSADNSSHLDYVAIYHDQANGRILSGAGALGIGTGTPIHAGALGDLYVSLTLEVQGVTYFRNNVTHKDGQAVALGDSNDAVLLWSTAQTNDALVLGLGNTSRAFIICDAADSAVDRTIANKADPTLFIFGNGTGVSDYVSIYFDTANSCGRLLPGTGYLAVGAGTTSHSLSAADDLLVSDDLEVDGTLWADQRIISKHTVSVAEEALPTSGNISLAANAYNNFSCAMAGDVDINGASHPGYPSVIHIRFSNASGASRSITSSLAASVWAWENVTPPVSVANGKTRLFRIYCSGTKYFVSVGDEV